MLMGSLIAGRAVDYFTHTVETTLVRNWQGFWLISALTAFLILLLISVFFRGGGKIQSAEPALEPSEAATAG
jgi:hypothetical protein